MSKLESINSEQSRNEAEEFSDMIVRHVRMNSVRSPMEAINATGRNKNIALIRGLIDGDVITTMPQGESKEADVYFFKVDRHMSHSDLDKECDLRGLKPADPYVLAAVNEADPAFADEHPNATHWKDAEGNWCYVAFNRWFDTERIVHVRRGGIVWDANWYIACVRK